MGRMPEPYEPVSWFSEGFTRYYEDLMLLRGGLESFSDYVQKFNVKLRNYGLDEARNVSLGTFVRRRTADKSIFPGLEYWRGSVIAAWLDGTIRDESGGTSSLNDLMFLLVRQNADYQRKHGSPMLLSNKRIFQAAGTFINRASLRRLRQYVENGRSIEVPGGVLGPCVQSHTEAIGHFELGFDRSSVSAEPHRAVGVQPESEAYKAGLRDGQQLIGWSIYNGDPTKQVKLTIKTKTGRQVITYYPQGNKVPVQQFVLDASAYSAKPEACSAPFRR
jgi:predicted metalloprotease with PDZ domain